MKDSVRSKIKGSVISPCSFLKGTIMMRVFLIISLFFVMFTGSAAEQLNADPTDFDVKQANQQFDRINLQLSVQNLNLNNLTMAINTLTAQTTKADKCVETLQKKLYGIEILIKQATNTGTISPEATSQEEPAKPGADLQYLNKQQKLLSTKQSQCRLFSIRAKEAINAYKTAAATLKQEEVLARGTPLWVTLKKAQHTPLDPSLLNTLKIIQSLLPPWPYWLLIVGSSLMGAIALIIRFRRSTFAHSHFQYKQSPPSHIILFSSIFIAFWLCLSIVIQNPLTDWPVSLFALLFCYLLSTLGVLLVFKLKRIIAIFKWYSLHIAFFQSLTLALLTIYAITLMGPLLPSFINMDHPLNHICHSFFLLNVIFTIAYFIYLFCKTHQHFPFIHNHSRAILNSSFLLLMLCILLHVLGYRTLTQYLVLSGLTSFSILVITLLLLKSIHKIYLAFYQKPALQLNVMKYFGYKSDQVFTEFLILKTTFQFIVITLSIYLISQNWGFATNYIGKIYDQLLHGIHLLNFTLYPARIVAGIIVFCLLYLGCRALSTMISRQQQFEDGEETQVAVASILSYLGFTLAALAGLLIAGFDFTGLAIIAGALSVGIGLGLQSIVNNFVSGIILLIEKPIRPGDRINVDGIEGFVKKIRIRSTQIVSPTMDDIILPNSDLITRRVTNYTFSNKYCRIQCEVSVAYGSNTNLVKEILLTIANSHEEIIKNSRNKPTVLFDAFAENSLIFHLGCLIKDVNKKSVVCSDLHFAIEQAFREHHINMATPRDIHITVNDIEPLLAHLRQK